MHFQQHAAACTPIDTSQLTWCVEDDGVDSHPLLEDGDHDGDNQLGPVAAAQDGAPGVAHGAGHVDSIDNILKLNGDICS